MTTATIVHVRTHGTFVGISVGDELVRLVMRVIDHMCPVHSLCKAQLGILLDAHGASSDEFEGVQSQLFQVEHLEYDQRVVLKQGLATDHRQVGEQVAE